MRRHLPAYLRQFTGDESGVLIIFALYMFVLMLMIGGIGIDLMRFERERTKLQNTMDAAVLAAADLDQLQDPTFVVEDYFDKAGLRQYLTDVEVEEGLNFRIVSGLAEGAMDTQFMHMMGIDSLRPPAASVAEERIGGVEISLVLDVSGSMNSNSKLSNLKVAARDFVDQMVDTTDDGDLSISIVPYATQVSAPDWFLSKFNVTNEHAYSNCVNFKSDDFGTTALPPTQELQRTMHFDPWDNFDGRDDDPKRLVRNPVCEDDSRREMMILQKDRDTLKDYISDLWGGGNTSIDVAMKWGTALLDPSIGPVVDQLIDEGRVSADFSDRPTAYNSNDALKVIVLMTDGMNTQQYYIEDDYRAGMSDIWWNDDEEKYSVHVGQDIYDRDNDGITDEPLFYWPHADEWADHAFGNGTYEAVTGETWVCTYYRWRRCRNWDRQDTYDTVDEPGTAEQLSYADLWAYTSLEQNVEHNYFPWMNESEAWNEWFHGVHDYVAPEVKDTRLLQICDAAKARQVIIFTIGFEAPSSSEELLRTCASSPAHYFDADGLEIADAFTAIASSIRQLRLTQ